MSEIIKIHKNRYDNGRKFIDLLTTAYLDTCQFPFLTYDQGNRLPLSLCDVSRAIHLQKLLFIGDEILQFQELRKVSEPNSDQENILFSLGVCWSQLEKHVSGEYTAVYLSPHHPPRSITLSAQRMIVDSHIAFQSSHVKALEHVFDVVRLSNETNEQILSELFQYELEAHYKIKGGEVLEVCRKELESMVSKINNPTIDVTN